MSMLASAWQFVEWKLHSVFKKGFFSSNHASRLAEGTNGINTHSKKRGGGLKKKPTQNN